MKRCLTIAALVALLACAGVSKASLVVFSPPHQSIVTTDKVVLEGIIKGGKPNQKVEIKIAGRTYKQVTSATGVRFSETLTLAPGVNTFLLIDSVDGKTASLEVCYSDGKKPPPPGFYKPVAHAALDDGCSGCHSEEGGAWKTTAEVPGTCHDCHDDAKAKKPASIHSPVDDGDCLSCHSVHFSPNGKLLLKPMPELCWECHDDVTVGKSKEEWKAPHAALDDGCPACHFPHASPVGKLLKTKAPDLCTGCHDDVAKGKDGKAWAKPHDPVGSGDCTACHKAHGSDTPKILSAPLPVLCNDCHDDVRMGGGKKPWPAPHSPVDDGDCGGCHNVHGSAVKALLKAKVPALCSECHDDVTVGRNGQKMAILHAPVEEGDCSGCHAIHGAEAAKILKRPAPALCRECHDDPGADTNGQEWGTTHKPVAQGACNACHSPHASAVGGLLLAPYNEICYKCHDAHSHPLQIKPVFKKKIELPKNLKATKKNELPCGFCHNVHGSDAAYMLSSDRQSLCLNCHKF
jgi:predicted CXXCH cytochrome family protein